MSDVITDNLLEVELEAELELLQEDNTLQHIDNIEIEDIFSSSEDDYKLFEFDTNDTITKENDNIWKSYFNKITVEQHKYLNESQNILCQMKQTCFDTLKMCNTNTTTNIISFPKIENKIIATPISPQQNTDFIQTTQEVITTNPCIPSYVTAESPTKHQSKPISSITSPQTPHKIHKQDLSTKQHTTTEIISQNTNTFKINITPSPSPDIIYNNSENKVDYNTELQKLENELKEQTEAHHQELQINSTVKWSTLLHESKELYDEYIETTQKINRDKEILIITQCFCGWKVEWERNKRKKLRLIKLTKDMECIVVRLMNKTVIRFQTKEHRLKLWSNLIIKYQHKNTMNEIHANYCWKTNVIDYIMFHFEQSYQKMINHRNYLKINCLPFICETAQYYKQRRLSVIKISIWYKHQTNKRKMIQILHGINKLCVFRKHYIENPLKENILISWIKCMKCRQYAIECFTKKINKHKMYQTLCYFRNKAKFAILKRKITSFRKCKNERTNYLITQKHRKENGALTMQSYFRMFYVRSIMNDIKTKLCAINDTFAIAINPEHDEFKELDENEYIFDQSIIDFDLQPLSNPPSPELSLKVNDKSVETESISESEHVDQSESESSCTSSEQSEIDEESKGDDNIESDAENEDEEKLEVQDLSRNNKDSGCWTFENQKVAQSWMKRRKKFKSKKSTKNRFNMKRKSHSFGSSNRFNAKQKKESNKKQKSKLVKFGCP